jgi:DNA-binding NarL/FixJ family response regulator
MEDPGVILSFAKGAGCMEVFLSKQADLHTNSEAHSLQVMVVDAQDVFRRKIRDILHGIGGFHVVAETPSCRMALETAERMRIDLVIAELALEDGDGVTLTTHLKQLSTPPRVIIFSSMLHDVTLLQVVLAGADGYLLKDTSTRDIIRAFKNFERGGPAMQPVIAAHVIRLLVERCKTASMQPVMPAVASTQPLSSLDPLLIPQTPVNGTSHISSSSPFSRLSPQEEKVLAFLRLGESNKQIASRLAISPYTVGKHVQSILRKLGVVNRTQAAAYTSFEG